MILGGQVHAPADLPPGKARYLFYRRLVWTGEENLAFTGIRFLDHPARRYTYCIHTCARVTAVNKAVIMAVEDVLLDLRSFGLWIWFHIQKKKHNWICSHRRLKDWGGCTALSRKERAFSRWTQSSTSNFSAILPVTLLKCLKFSVNHSLIICVV